MASVEWRKIPTVLYPQEVLDKAFRRASKQSTLVEDPDKYHRVRKQMPRMVQAASDTIAETLLKWVDQWPSLNAQSEFDQALVDAAVGANKFRQNLGALQWAAERVRKIAGESQSKMLKFRNIEAFHEERRHAYGRMSSIIEQIGENEGRSMAAGAAMAVVGWWTGYKLGGVLSLFAADILQNIGFENYWQLTFLILGILVILMNIGLMFIDESGNLDRQNQQKENDKLISSKFKNENIFTKLITWVAGTIGGPIISFFKKQSQNISRYLY